MLLLVSAPGWWVLHVLKKEAELLVAAAAAEHTPTPRQAVPARCLAAFGSACGIIADGGWCCWGVLMVDGGPAQRIWLGARPHRDLGSAAEPARQGQPHFAVPGTH